MLVQMQSIGDRWRGHFLRNCEPRIFLRSGKRLFVEESRSYALNWLKIQSCTIDKVRVAVFRSLQLRPSRGKAMDVAIDPTLLPSVPQCESPPQIRYGKLGIQNNP